MSMPGSNPFGRLVESGALAPRGSSGSMADSHTDDTADPIGAGTVPVWASNSMPAIAFLVIAFIVWRVALR